MHLTPICVCVFTFVLFFFYIASVRFIHRQSMLENCDVTNKAEKRESGKNYENRIKKNTFQHFNLFGITKFTMFAECNVNGKKKRKKM